MKKNNVIKRGCNTITAQIIYDEGIKKYGEFVTFKKEEYNTTWILKDLKGKAKWEQMMIAKQRKTMVLCKECHKKIHKKRVSN